MIFRNFSILAAALIAVPASADELRELNFALGEGMVTEVVVKNSELGLQAVPKPGSSARSLVEELGRIGQKIPRLRNLSSPQELQRVFEQVRGLSFLNFQNAAVGCESRAHYTSLFLELQGIRSEKIFVNGRGGFDLNLNGSDIHWHFHVAPIVWVTQPDGRLQGHVIDPSMYEEPVALPQWLADFGEYRDEKPCELVAAEQVLANWTTYYSRPTCHAFRTSRHFFSLRLLPKVLEAGGLTPNPAYPSGNLREFQRLMFAEQLQSASWEQRWFSFADEVLGLSHKTSSELAVEPKLGRAF